MKTRHFALWLETCAGQRTLIALSASRSYALMIGEALWAHYGQVWATTLDLRLLEVQKCHSPYDLSTPQTIARWSASGQENVSNVRAFGVEDAAEKQRPLPPRSPSSEQQTERAESLGLSACFPTAQEWALWKAWRPSDR